jgi:2-haloacid dehalogenase
LAQCLLHAATIQWGERLVGTGNAVQSIGEDQIRVAVGLPKAAQYQQGLRGQWNETVAVALGVAHVHALVAAIDVAGLPWDCILKPHPDTYLGVARIFDLQADDVLMVAAHQDDLAGARSCGLQTAYIQRPLEFGTTRTKDVSDNGLNTYHVNDLIQLADVLGA